MFYNFVKRNGQDYIVNNGRSTVIMSENEIKYLINQGNKFKGLNLVGNSLFEVSNSIISVYTGKDLESYINKFLSANNVQFERDFVSELYVKLTNNSMRIIGVSGLRGVGKTVGLLQCLRDLNVLDDSVYIELNTRYTDESFTAQDFADYIQQNFSDKKYIFIDEITSIKNFTVSAAKYYNAISRVK